VSTRDFRKNQRVARDAGMTCVVVVTKHHDDFNNQATASSSKASPRTREALHLAPGSRQHRNHFIA